MEAAAKKAELIRRLRELDGDQSRDTLLTIAINWTPSQTTVHTALTSALDFPTSSLFTAVTAPSSASMRHGGASGECDRGERASRSRSANKQHRRQRQPRHQHQEADETDLESSPSKKQRKEMPTDSDIDTDIDSPPVKKSKSLRKKTSEKQWNEHDSTLRRLDGMEDNGTVANKRKACERVEGNEGDAVSGGPRKNKRKDTSKEFNKRGHEYGQVGQSSCQGIKGEQEEKADITGMQSAHDDAEDIMANNHRAGQARGMSVAPPSFIREPNNLRRSRHWQVRWPRQ